MRMKRNAVSLTSVVFDTNRIKLHVVILRSTLACWLLQLVPRVSGSAITSHASVNLFSATTGMTVATFPMKDSTIVVRAYVRINQNCDSAASSKQIRVQAFVNCLHGSRTFWGGLHQYTCICSGIMQLLFTTFAACGSGRRRCDVGTCISIYDWCDGRRDCPDGSDEVRDCRK